MSVNITVTLTDREADAVLGSNGLTNGYGSRKSSALASAELKLTDAVQAGWNDRIDVKEAHARCLASQVSHQGAQASNAEIFTEIRELTTAYPWFMIDEFVTSTIANLLQQVAAPTENPINDGTHLTPGQWRAFTRDEKEAHLNEAREVSRFLDTADFAYHDGRIHPAVIRLAENRENEHNWIHVTNDGRLMRMHMWDLFVMDYVPMWVSTPS
ncbi:hypothetical protein [Arthrobacter sp. A2-55]|uniref:hypothetical protein n=1 Tax=Arthrobacter sp. A2-55 TaxID=2897337 RepID=UPI0021CDC576|nr:hypothetical protein [Arthrobacter sp. A2-55]MCU6480504.1 hypothetical protein [Arthrobacter sp. A2-55]